MEAATIEEVLRSSVLFGGASDSALTELAEAVVVKSYPRAATVLVEGEPGSRMFVIAEGMVKVYRRSPDGQPLEIRRIGPGGHTGEIAVIDGKPRTASVDTTVRSTLVWITGEQLWKVLAVCPEVNRRLLENLCMMLRESSDDRANLAFLNTRGRLAGRLLQLTASFGSLTHEQRVSQTDLANMIS